MSLILEQSIELERRREVAVRPRPLGGGKELHRSRLAPALVMLYRLVKGHKRWTLARVIFDILRRLEKGPCHTATVRQLLAKYHEVNVGAYSYGDCLIPGAFPPMVTVGRFTSIGPGARVYNQNHPLDHLSTHPYFYDPGMGLVSDSLPRNHLVVGHDVWMGRNVVVTPSCTRIGNGAVIGAGAVVTRDVDDYAIIAGVPAKLIRYRFPEETRRLLLAARWWERSIDECAEVMEQMVRPLDDPWSHPLLVNRGTEKPVREVEM